MGHCAPCCTSKLHGVGSRQCACKATEGCAFLLLCSADQYYEVLNKEKIRRAETAAAREKSKKVRPSHRASTLPSQTVP